MMGETTERVNHDLEEVVIGEGACRDREDTWIKHSTSKDRIELIGEAVRDLEDVEYRRAMLREYLLRNYRHLDHPLPEPLYRRVLLLLSV